MPKNCVSLCSGLDKDTCNTKKECIFTDGPKMKYCRLNSNYTMDKDCNVTRKNGAKESPIVQAKAYTLVPAPVMPAPLMRVPAPLVPAVEEKAKRCPKGTRKNKKTGLCEPTNTNVVAPMNVFAPTNVVAPMNVVAPTNVVAPMNVFAKKLTPKNVTLKKLSPNKKEAEIANAQLKAKEVILRFMRKTKYKRKAEFLKAVCSDAGVCIAFGTFNEEIKKFFGGFTNFVYAEGPIKRIGTPSSNGFINEINYTHRGYKAQAILKSTNSVRKDNLMYEYMVGMYINKLNKCFPCFLETYGYYIYNDNASWDKMKKTKNITSTDILKNGLTLQKSYDYVKACSRTKYLSVLIQHLKGIISMRDMIRNASFVQNDLVYALFQLYMPLSIMKNNFTHYDLHHENVFLYEPVKNKYIEYHYYKGSTRIVSFKSSYIVKIIDYGRSYFNDTNGNIDSLQIYDNLCATPVCNKGAEKCGYSQGFNFDGLKEYFISSLKKNVSHDLRLMYNIKYNLGILPSMPAFLKDLIQKVEYGVGISLLGDKQYGTIENTNSGLPAKIVNVDDAAKALLEYITTDKMSNNAFYMSKVKLGDLHVYDDGRPMRFIKV